MLVLDRDGYWDVLHDVFCLERIYIIMTFAHSFSL